MLLEKREIWLNSAYILPYLPSASSGLVCIDFPHSRSQLSALLTRCFAQSQNAYQSGDGARAHDLSEQGKAHQAKKAQIDAEARDWIYYRSSFFASSSSFIPLFSPSLDRFLTGQRRLLWGDWVGGETENNTDSKPGEIDLHGLYVKEAVAKSEQAIQVAQQRGDSEIHFIVGKGNHSAGHVAKIKPAIEELMEKCVPSSPSPSLVLRCPSRLTG